MVYMGWKWCPPVWLVLMLAACGGNPVLPAPTSVSVTRVDFAAIEAKLKRNSTNQLQVHALLGAPHAVGVSVEASGARHEEWLYYFSAANGANGAGRSATSSLEIKFDRQGVVRGYRWVEPKTP